MNKTSTGTFQYWFFELLFEYMVPISLQWIHGIHGLQLPFFWENFGFRRADDVYYGLLMSHSMLTWCLEKNFIYVSGFFLLGTFQSEPVLFSAGRQTGNHNYQFYSCCFLSDLPIIPSICSMIPFPQLVFASSSYYFLSNFHRNCQSNYMARNCYVVFFQHKRN